MGNNVSHTRKSSARDHGNGGVRKSNLSHNNQQDLDEEFSDLILHEVKRQHNALGKSNEQGYVGDSQDAEAGGSESVLATSNGLKKNCNQFSNDLLEDEYNELNDGLLDTEGTEVTRNILPHDESDSEMDVIEKSSSNTPLEQTEDKTPTPNLSDVDFTKLSKRQGEVEHIEDLGTMQSDSSSSLENMEDDFLVPVEIKWVNTFKEPIQKISIIGSFSNWRNVIRLYPSLQQENVYATTIRLPLGVHKLLYIINNEYRVSEQLPTATDQEGILFNWFEVLDNRHLFNKPHTLSSERDANIISVGNSASDPEDVQTAGKHDVHRIQKKLNSFLAKISKEDFMTDVEHVEYTHDEGANQHGGQEMQVDEDENGTGIQKTEPSEQDSKTSASESISSHQTESQRSLAYNEVLSSSFLKETQKRQPDYSHEIPEMFVDYSYYSRKSANYEIPEPPQLPAHLNNVLLNKLSSHQHQSQNQNIPTITDHSNYQQVHQPQMTPFQHTNLSQALSSSSTIPHRPPLRRADSSYYASNVDAHRSIPNHVILNHLMTTSIKNEVLTVACITRYSGKFVTQIMHSPADM